MLAYAGSHTGCADEPRPRNNQCSTIAGDVYSIQESVYTAVFDVLQASAISDRELFKKCRMAAHELFNKERATHKKRPCIIMQDGPDLVTMPRKREIVLTASWEGTAITDLPMLFQYFSVPIHRNRNISGDKPDHYHSLPEWDIEDGYLFAWRFRSTRSLINRWPEKEAGAPPEEPYVFGQKAWGKIVADCEAKRREWLRMCREDPTFADARARECLEHYDKWSAERDKASQNDAVSRASVQTGFTFNSGFTWGTRASGVSRRSRQPALSALKCGTERRRGGADSDNWRRCSHARINSEAFVSATAATNAVHEGTATSPTHSKAKDADRSSVVRAASNRFSIHRHILIPSRRGSRDY